VQINLLAVYKIRHSRACDYVFRFTHRPRLYKYEKAPQVKLLHSSDADNDDRSLSSADIIGFWIAKNHRRLRKPGHVDNPLDQRETSAARKSLPSHRLPGIRRLWAIACPIYAGCLVTVLRPLWIEDCRRDWTAFRFRVYRSPPGCAYTGVSVTELFFREEVSWNDLWGS